MGFETENISKATLKWSTIHKGSSWFSTDVKQMCVRVHNNELCMQSVVFLLDFSCAFLWARRYP